MAIYLTARLSGSRGFGPVGASTLQSALSKMKGWLQLQTGQSNLTTFSTMQYPKLFRTMSRVADLDARRPLAKRLPPI